MSPEPNIDFKRLFEADQSLPPTSHRRLGGFIVFLKRFLAPLGDLVTAGRREPQRRFNLHVLQVLEEHASRFQEERARLEKAEHSLRLEMDAYRTASETHRSRFQEAFDGLQREVLALRDEKVPALLEGQDLGLKAVDMKAEWALARLVQMRALLEKGVPLPAMEAQEAARSLHYAQFEDAFRGAPEAIRAGLEPYWDVLGDRRPVLDLGCGRGEFIELLMRKGIPCLGVEQNPALAASLREKGLPFEQADALAFLQKGGPDYGAVAAIHFIEHFTAADARVLLRLAFDRLAPGGMLLLETPNPASLAAFLNWHKDPDHRTPWHPETLKFYLEQTGFTSVEVRFLHPFPPRPELALPKAAEDLLFGFQDYAVWGTKPE